MKLFRLDLWILWAAAYCGQNAQNVCAHIKQIPLYIKGNTVCQDTASLLQYHSAASLQMSMSDLCATQSYMQVLHTSVCETHK